jgi:hypothetical protein
MRRGLERSGVGLRVQDLLNSEGDGSGQADFARFRGFGAAHGPGIQVW